MREQPLLLNVVLRDRNGTLVASGAEAVTDRTPARAPAYLMEVAARPAGRWSASCTPGR